MINSTVNFHVGTKDIEINASKIVGIEAYLLQLVFDDGGSVANVFVKGLDQLEKIAADLQEQIELLKGVTDLE